MIFSIHRTEYRGHVTCVEYCIQLLYVHCIRCHVNKRIDRMEENNQIKVLALLNAESVPRSVQGCSSSIPGFDGDQEDVY